jgi:hypothetical protein
MDSQTLTERREVEQLPDGSIILWRMDADDPESEVVAIVEQFPDGSTGLKHSYSAYWMSDVDELVHLPCTVLRRGRPGGEDSRSGQRP